MQMGSEADPAGHQSKGQLKEISITFQALSISKIPSS